MDANQINVDNFIDVSAIIKQLDINIAKELLKENGYFVDNLWKTCDITDIWDCTDEQAQELLYKALTSESTIEQIHIAINFMAEDMNLKEK